MQFDKRGKLKREWEARGNPPCDHPHSVQEHIGSAGTGDYVCTTCGAYVDRN